MNISSHQDKRVQWPFLLSLLVLFVLAVLVMAFLQFPQGQKESLREIEEYADILMNRELYTEAAEAYKEALRLPNLSRADRAKLNYLLATLYFEHLNTYTAALARFEKVRQLDRKSGLSQDAEKKIIQCLEKLGRSLDAQVEMEQSVALKPERSRTARGPVVAKIGEREITEGDIQERLKRLPPAVRGKFAKPEDRLKLVQEYVVTELLYDAAKRKGLDTDPDVQLAVDEARKSFMVQKLLDDQIAPRIAPTQEELRKYYEAHKKKYIVMKNGKPIGQKSFASAAAEVRADFIREREQALYQQLIQEQLKTQDVKLFADRILPEGKQ